MRELILGGNKSGKSRAAEARASDWLRTPGHSALLIATAQAGDDEMHARIARHRKDRALRVPQLMTLEEPLSVAALITAQTCPERLLVVDCLTLWLTNLVLPMHGTGVNDDECDTRRNELCDALVNAAGPVVLVSNEISLGITPLGSEVRRFLDHLGMLHQRLAARCERVTLMVAGIEMNVKGRLL